MSKEVEYSRCSICDYCYISHTRYNRFYPDGMKASNDTGHSSHHEGSKKPVGSKYPNDGGRGFHYNKIKDEYICDRCYNEIHTTLEDFKDRDEYTGVKTDNYDDISEEEIDRLLKELGCAYVDKDR